MIRDCWLQLLMKFSEKMQTKRLELNIIRSCFVNQMQIKPKALCFCSVYISHSPWKKVAQCEGHTLCFENSWAVMALGALCPHYKTRGTSGVSLFLLNPQGASVYHAPKYEPIFSIILWSPRMSVCRESPPLQQTHVRKTFCHFALSCIFLIKYESEKPLEHLILPQGVKKRKTSCGHICFCEECIGSCLHCRYCYSIFRLHCFYFSFFFI